jgi:type IV secretion system protein VirB8
MNQESFALPVDRAGLSEHYKQVESFQRDRAKAARRTSKVLAAVAGIAIVANLGQAWTIAALLPLTKIVPVYLWAHPDGTIDSSVALSRLPATQSQAVVTAALWAYVRLREGYSYDTAQYDYDAVSGMSADAPRTQYQRWFNYPNAVSPQVTVGKKGVIEIQHISSANIATNVQQIRYPDHHRTAADCHDVDGDAAIRDRCHAADCPAPAEPWRRDRCVLSGSRG